MVLEKNIELANLTTGLPGVSPRRGSEHYEAALVCLADRNHNSGVKCDIKNINETLAELALYWSEQVTEQMKNSWNDGSEATESGAVGIAILVILELTEYTIIRRSKQGTGVDYWLGYKNDSVELGENVLQGNARLEVSGIRMAERDSAIVARLRQNIEQSSKSESSRIPAYIIVCEFSRPVVYMARRTEG